MQRISTAPAPIRERVADRLVEALVRVGVDTVYGIPGGAISPIYDALIAHPQIRVVHVRHETSALYMAIGHTRARPGSLPCVLVTSGPGVTNALTGLAAASGEGAPVLVIAGEVPRSRFGRHALQEGSPETLDVVNVVRTVTRSSASITLPGHAVYQVIEAARRARAMRGPVFLSLPLDVAVAEVPASTYLASAALPPQPDAAALAAAGEALRRARRPLFLLGSGARGAAQAVCHLTARMRIPVITSPKAKGVVPETMRHCMGVFGYGGHPSAAQWLQRHPPDVVVALGCGLTEPSTNSWSTALQASGTMIQVDVDPSRFGRNYRTDIAIECDVATAVSSFAEALDGRPPWDLPLTGVTRYEHAKPTDPDGALAPGRVIATLQEELPPTTLYTADIGEHLLFAIHYLALARADQFTASLAFGSMGSGIGAAIGLKLASPERPVVAICGDYGFQMYGMELNTCVQERLDVTFVVMNDARMRMVEAGLGRNYGRALPMHGPLVDFAAVARGHGARGFVARTLDELREALTSPSDQGPSVIDVRIDPASSFPMNARVQEISNWTSK